MKQSTITTALALAMLVSPIWGHAAKAQDPHHPEGGASVQTANPPGQPAMGGMNMMGEMPMMNMMGMMGSGMATIDRVEGRIAFLRAELKISDAQTGAWNVFADALRTNAKKLGEVRAAMLPQPGAGQQQTQTMAERLDLQERWLLARLEGIRTIKSAFTNLVGTLSDSQKKTADELLAPHMGMGMTAMMSGRMQSGQMQPGQMQSGQMQPGQMRPGPR